MTELDGKARAVARANIALAKYWGKADVALNLPAVPSISLTLDGLVTRTSVRFDKKLEADVVELDGREATAKEAGRVVELLDRVRAAAKATTRAKVVSTNRFPTAAGLASSASGFAALAGAASHAAGLGWGPRKISSEARRSSASAARSVYGGFAELPAGQKRKSGAWNGFLPAKALHGPDHWDLRLIVAETVRGPKKVGSTEGMERSRTTSPYYEAWVAEAPVWADALRAGLKKRDLPAVGEAMERSTLAFHTCAITAHPSILYWQPATVGVLHAVRALREAKGLACWATMDAGPHVKVLCAAEDARKIRAALKKVEGVSGTLVCKPGAGLEVR
ncbi:MAG: diphosphomevalonate decarboxylase [Myxococcota bacterium]